MVSILAAQDALAAARFFLAQAEHGKEQAQFYNLEAAVVFGRAALQRLLDAVGQQPYDALLTQHTSPELRKFFKTRRDTTIHGGPPLIRGKAELILWKP